ncbi:MAG: family 10 glycosylhydrolase [Chloroflexota bacterium]|nr:family 10 glycosylhydrolase [Chloroflexota bacterium]
MRAGIYTYPWDLAAEGHDLALGRIADAGLRAVNLACAYHAGKFLLPHNPRHRVYFAEDGALYFRPDPAKYGRIQPRVSALVTEDSDPLTDLDRARRPRGLDIVAWVVCLHNSWLGERYPDCAVHSPFGDPIIHALCPAHPDVRAYLAAMVGDLVSRVEVAAVELEAPGYTRFVHGFHHELIGVPLDPTQELLLGLSFNPAELERARAAGADGAGLRRRVANLLTEAWRTGKPLETADGPTREARRLLDDPEFAAYARLREDVVISLAAELRDTIHAASPSTELRLFAPLGRREHDGATYGGLAAVADAALAGYASSDAEVVLAAAGLREQMGGKRVYGRVRAVAPDTVHPAQVAPRVAAWRQAGVDGINVYNYGLMTLPMLQAIGEALRGKG